jgi:Right handed beta helix region
MGHPFEAGTLEKPMIKRLSQVGRTTLGLMDSGNACGRQSKESRMAWIPVSWSRTATVLCCLSLAVSPALARKLLVGTGKAYAKPSLAAADAQNGDTVEIDPGVYESDACSWDADNLVIRVPGASEGKRAHLKSNGVHAQGKGIWVVGGKNTTIEGIEFSGAKVPDENGAGIRQEGPGVTIRYCYFHDNENGILADGGDMVIEYSEFAHNGLGEVGRTHNIYVSSATSLTFRYCYTHHAVIGHNLKSRAQKNFILYNRIMDEADGTGSYDIDLPNGGLAVILGNTIQQGPETDNSIVVAYGAEGLKFSTNELYVVHNTLVNDRSGGTYFSIDGKPTVSKFFNNFFSGNGTLFTGTVTDTSANMLSANAGFLDKAKYDYRLSTNSPAIDKAVDAGTGGGMSLIPEWQYLHPSGREPRKAVSKLDIGAFEWSDAATLRRKKPERRGSAAPHGRMDLGNGAHPSWLIPSLGLGDRCSATGKSWSQEPDFR